MIKYTERMQCIKPSQCGRSLIIARTGRIIEIVHLNYDSVNITHSELLTTVCSPSSYCYNDIASVSVHFESVLLFLTFLLDT